MRRIDREREKRKRKREWTTIILLINAGFSAEMFSRRFQGRKTSIGRCVLGRPYLAACCSTDGWWVQELLGSFLTVKTDKRLWFAARCQTNVRFKQIITEADHFYWSIELAPDQLKTCPKCLKFPSRQSTLSLTKSPGRNKIVQLISRQGTHRLGDSMQCRIAVTVMLHKPFWPFPSHRIQKFKSDLHVFCPSHTKDQTRPLTFLGCSMQISFPFLSWAGPGPRISTFYSSRGSWLMLEPAALNYPLFAWYS